MSDRLKRFRRLERARQDGDPADPRGPSPGLVSGPVSGRFAAIEPRGPRPAPADPFAPPTDAAREIMIAHEAPREVGQAQADKRARALAQLEVAEVALQQARADRDAGRRARGGERVLHAVLHAVAELGTPVRVLLIAAVIVGTMIAADVLGPLAWLVGPLPIAVIGASFFVDVEHP